ncbi:MAG: MSMEG_0565 family glycosyltransferase [Cyanobacteria bacterium J06642_9]
MKIALLTYSTKPRGSVIHTLELATALTALNHSVSVFALDKDGQGFEQSLACIVRLVPAKAAPKEVDALIQQRIQEFSTFLTDQPLSFDIYHAQDCIGANALLELRQQGKISHFVRTVHHIEDYTSPYLQQCQDKSIRTPNLCLCVSDRWQKVLKTDYGIDAPRIINGVNPQRFSTQLSGQEAALKQRYGLTGSPLYLTVGGIEPRKNSIRLLEAFAQVLDQYPQAQLAIAGGATLFDYQPYRDRFFQIAKTLNIDVGPSLVLPGVIPAADLPALYRCADVFCFPSVREGWGLVVLEAIASGLPIVISQQPPFTEFLEPNQACWANPNDVSTIANAMIQALSVDPKASRTQNHSVLSEYSWHRSAQLHLKHYQRLYLS